MSFCRWICLPGRKRILLKQYLFFGLVVASLPFMVYLLRFTHSKSFSVQSDTSFFTNANILEASPRQRTLAENTSNARKFRGEQNSATMNVHMWSGLCGMNVDHLRNWPHFPHLPHKRYFIPEFSNIRTSNDSGNSGERIYGFIHLERGGQYKFAITSDGPSELWLSPNEDSSSSKLIARVYSPNESASTLKGDFKKYPEQISKEITLDAGKKYYIESLSMIKQGAGETHVAVYWLYNSSKNSSFEIISSKYPSRMFKDNDSETVVPPHPGKQRVSLQSRIDFYHFSRLPLVSKTEYGAFIPTCSYSPSFLVRRKIKRYSGVWMSKESLVFPQDDTDMFNTAKVNEWQKWSVPNPVADKNKVYSVVDKLMTYLRSRNYYLKKIHKVIQKPDSENGDRFLVDLEIGSNTTSQSFRLTEHVYQKNGSAKLCLPEGMNWNNNATVYFIIPVKDQGKWLQYFIEQLTDASLLTGDTNFHVIIVDFESKDIDMDKAFNTSLLSSRHTVVQLTGKFYKTLALNKAVEVVPNAHDIIFLFDLHIDVPADIMDSVRKNTIPRRMAYFPAVGRLDCGRTPVDHIGFWQMDGFGLMAMYKSDWNRLGGMNIEDYKFKWGGEDWDLIDRVLMMTFEVERIKYPGLYHHYHVKGKWN